MQLGVSQLEELFVKNKQDNQVLRQLESELQYRQVPRAIALLAEVQAELYTRAAPPTPVISGTPVPSPAPAPAPAVTAAPPSVGAAPATVKMTGAGISENPARGSTVAKAATTAPSASDEPPMGLDEALKVLRAAPGSTWESIEQTRRQVVQLASPVATGELPPERRDLLLVAARRVNRAYATLLRARAST